jgi:hypothetical protein
LLSLLALASALLGAGAPRAAADYSPPPLNDLVLGSEAIVTGRIDALAAQTFTLRVQDLVDGPITTPTIEVRRFEDWTCASRWAPYAVGQQVLLFLREDPQGGPWQIRSAGGEGEMPISRGVAYVHSYYMQMAPAGTSPRAYGPHTVHGGRYGGFAVGVGELLDALRQARSCFQAQRSQDRYRRVTGVTQTCTAASAAAAQRSPIGASLFRALAP